MLRDFRSSFILPLVLTVSGAAFCQTAPQLTAEICGELQHAAEEYQRQFGPLPTGCRINIDRGYDLAVDYIEHSIDGTRSMSLSLRADFEFLNGDASALWLHLSAFDGLSHLALGTKPQAVFDGLSTLIKSLAVADLKGNLHQGAYFEGHADKAYLLAMTDGKVVAASAGAEIKDIDRMKRARGNRSGDQVPTWRRILGLSLQVFGAGAQGYANAYRGPNTPQWQSQPVHSAPKTCYTNFIGSVAYTNCY